MTKLNEVVIVDAVRTAIGSFGGALSSIPATQLGSIVIEALIKRSNIDKGLVDEVIMGTVLPANLGQAPARQAALGAGLPASVECMTINKVCGSGLKSVMLAAQAIMLGDAEIVIAGGMENMSRAPHYLDTLRSGIKMGDSTLTDSMIKDGLWDVYNNCHMGNIAEQCAAEHNISRAEQDDFAMMSYKRAKEAQAKGLFKDEIIPIETPQRKGDPIIFDTDEEPSKVNFEKLKTLRSVFKKDGTVTAANASSINDGASAVLVMSREKAEALNLKPMAKIVAQASASKSPDQFTVAPTDAINKVLAKANLTKDDIDVYEINEAFSVVSLANNRLLNLSDEKVNINGGAVALGHPIGASGARVLTTLLYVMRQKEAKYGLASLCIGGGEASAVVVSCDW